MPGTPHGPPSSVRSLRWALSGGFLERFRPQQRYSATASISPGSSFLTLPTRLSIGQQVIRSAGYDAQARTPRLALFNLAPLVSG
jgi:hypothetical protein